MLFCAAIRFVLSDIFTTLRAEERQRLLHVRNHHCWHEGLLCDTDISFVTIFMPFLPEDVTRGPTGRRRACGVVCLCGDRV